MLAMVRALPSAMVTVLVLAFIVALTHPFGPVSRPRLERFARRERLVITTENGPRVIAYLRTTRRWRSSGVLIGLGVDSVAAAAGNEGALYLGGLGTVAGWFVGAVIAEWRVGSGSRDGVLRAASLAPRRASRYVPRSLPVFGAAAFVGVTAFTVVALLAARAGRLVLGGWLLLVLTSAVVIGSVARHVLLRPRALTGDAVVADDALRSRSLHVLLGSGLALAGFYLAAVAHAAKGDLSWIDDTGPTALTQVGSLALFVAGVLFATSVFDTRTDRRLTGATA